MIARALTGGLVAAMLAAGTLAQSDWRLEQVESRLTHLSSVSGSSAGNVFAAGSRGVILRFDGSRWSRQKGGGGGGLTSVWVASATRAFAVGLDGLILAYNGRGWEAQKSGTESRFGPRAIWGAPTGELFVVGTNGFVLTKGVR